MSRTAVVVLAALAVVGCRRRNRVPQTSPPSVAAVVAAPAPAPPPAPRPDPDELLPGDRTAFGLVMPLGATPLIETSSSRMFTIVAPMNKVMRYLQQRLVFHQGDVHPLGAMIRGARVSGAGVAFVVDVGVRDEGNTTLVTVWNRTPAAPVPGSNADAYRAAGVDPRTGRQDPRLAN